MVIFSLIDLAPQLGSASGLNDVSSACHPLEELSDLYQSLSDEQRAELLEEILVASHRGTDSVFKVLDVWLLERGLKRLVEGEP